MTLVFSLATIVLVAHSQFHSPRLRHIPLLPSIPTNIFSLVQLVVAESQMFVFFHIVHVFVSFLSLLEPCSVFPLQYLSEVQHLNLGFNQIDSIPVAPSQGGVIKFQLTTLILRNNNLQNIKGWWTTLQVCLLYGIWLPPIKGIFMLATFEFRSRTWLINHSLLWLQISNGIRYFYVVIYCILKVTNRELLIILRLLFANFCLIITIFFSTYHDVLWVGKKSYS